MGVSIHGIALGSQRCVKLTDGGRVPTWACANRCQHELWTPNFYKRETAHRLYIGRGMVVQRSPRGFEALGQGGLGSQPMASAENLDNRDEPLHLRPGKKTYSASSSA